MPVDYACSMTESRRELIQVFAPTFGLGDAVMEKLCRDGRLPHDVKIKASFTEDSSESLTRAVLAAIADEPLPGFVNEPLPQSMILRPNDYRLAIRPILRALDDDYHILHDLIKVSEGLDVQKWCAKHIWVAAALQANPSVFKILEDSNIDPLRHGWLYATIISDSALYETYRGFEDHPITARVGRRAMTAVGYLLIDNHPELYDELEGARQSIDK